MSSPTGPRASGTDGSDFGHREQVASHYKDSVKWKLKLRLNLFLHLALVMVGTLCAVLSHFNVIQYETHVWQLVWLFTAIPINIAINSLSKNRHNLLYIYIAGLLVLGFGPMIYGATVYIKMVMKNLEQDKADTLNMRGFSIKLALIALAVQMQITGIYYAVRLIKAWTSKGEKKSS